MFALSSIDRAVIAQRCSAVLDAIGQHVTERLEKTLGLRPGHSPPRRIDPREPRSFVGVDVANSRYWPLAEQLGLDSPIA